MATAGTSNSFLVAGPFEQAVSSIKRALSKHGLEILRECDVGSRLLKDVAVGPQKCRLMYIADPALLITAMRTHASAALWLPVPLLLIDKTVHTRTLFPVEAIVRDRAALLGLLGSVQDLYECLAAALRSVATTDQPA